MDNPTVSSLTADVKDLIKEVAEVEEQVEKEVEASQELQKSVLKLREEIEILKENVAWEDSSKTRKKISVAGEPDFGGFPVIRSSKGSGKSKHGFPWNGSKELKDVTNCIVLETAGQREPNVVEGEAEDKDGGKQEALATKKFPWVRRLFEEDPSERPQTRQTKVEIEKLSSVLAQNKCKRKRNEESDDATVVTLLPHLCVKRPLAFSNKKEFSYI